eukprot:8091359-Alexandrium_andersonii.AAC.1
MSPNGPNGHLRGSESAEIGYPFSEAGAGGAALHASPPAPGSALWGDPMFADSEPRKWLFGP